MCIVFVEYRIEQEFRTDYLTWTADLKQKFEQVNIYEGAEQPDLFVEIWEGLSDAAYTAMKTDRTGTIKTVTPDEAADKLLWRRMEPWIAGGRAKLHIWRFNKVSS